MLYLVLASLLLLHTEWTVVRSTSFCTITKSNIANRIVITLTPPPTSSRKNLLQSKRFGNNNFIHDIVFCPNIAFCATSTDGQVQDDDHFCSRLCDRGFRVHICLPATDLLLNASITTTSKATETFKSSTKSTIRKTQFYRSNIDCVDKNNDNNKKDDKMRFFKSVALHLNLRMPNTAIIAQEVSVPSLLRYLSDNVSRKSELPAAVVLTDPPPLIPLYSNADRTRLLNDRFPIQLKNIIDKRKGEKVTISIPVAVSSESYEKTDEFEQMSNQYSTSLPSFSSEADALSYEILGGAPSQSWDVGQNMKDRILVLSSIPDIPFVTPVYSTSQPADIDQDYYSFPEEGAFSLGNTFVPSDTWGLSAANEVAQQYSAGPVIKVGLLREPKDDDDDDEDDEDDNNSMIISSNDDTLSNSVTESVETKCDDSKFTFIDSFASKYSRSIDDDKGQIAVEGDICDGGWSASDVKRHTDIANVVTDWLDMLSYMKYI